MENLKNEINILLSHTSDQSIAFDELLRLICQCDGIDSGGLYLVNSDNSLTLVSHYGLSDNFIEMVKYYQWDTPNAKVVNKGDIKYNFNLGDSYYDGIKSAVIIPIRYNNKSIASLNLASHKYDEISKDTLYFLNDVAMSLGGAISRIKSEQVLKITQRNLESLFNTIEDFIFILDENANILSVNKYVKDRLEYNDSEIIGKNVLMFHSDKDRDTASKIIEKMLNGEIDVCDLSLVTKNNKLIPVDTKVVRGIWNDKNSLFGISRDITERVKYENILQKSLKLQTLIADISQKLNTIIDFNDDIENILGMIGQELNVSRVYIFEDNINDNTTSNKYEWCNIDIISHKNDLQNISYDVIKWWKDTLVNDGKIYSNNIKEFPDEIFEILDNQNIKSILVFPLYFEKDNIFGFIGFDDCINNRWWEKDEIELLRTVSYTFSNTFKRINYQIELKNSKDFSENLLKTSNVMVVGLDINGNVQIFNEDAEKLTGYHKNEILNKNWFNEVQILLKNDISRVNNIFENLLNEKEGFDIVENPIITKQGEIKYILWQNNEIKENGKIVGIISFGLDMSERKKFEQELIEAKNKAEQSNKMKLEFLANMSHDLRTPMNSIIGFSDLLKANNLTKNEKTDYINTIINNGKFLMALIDDIIDISKIDANSLNIENQDFELNKLLEELRLTYSKQIRDKKINIIIDVDINKNIIINTDKYRLKQIMTNLISNAIKFTNQGHVKFGYKILNYKYLELYVEDTGIGIERQHQKLIFQRFKQFGNKTKHKGAGLGLSISKSLVDLLGFGDIRLTSELDKGSKFYFMIPYTIKPYNYMNEVKNKRKNKKLNFLNKNILIVEDNPESVIIMKSYLNFTGANVFDLPSGDDVIKTIEDNKIDLVLLDIGLPGKSGYEILKDIRKINDRIPVIIESALAMPDQKSKAFELGCDDFISKPFHREDFLNKIDNLI